MASAREILMGPPGTAVSLNITRHESLFGIEAVKVNTQQGVLHPSTTAQNTLPTSRPVSLFP